VRSAREVLHVVGLPLERVQAQHGPADRPYPSFSGALRQIHALHRRSRAAAARAALGPRAGGLGGREDVRQRPKDDEQRRGSGRRHPQLGFKKWYDRKLAAGALPQVRSRVDDAVSGASAAPPLTAATAALCAATLLAALALDRLDPLWGQLAAGVVLWTFALRVIGGATAFGRQMLFWCMVWATVGELFCSLVWGLYTYRLGNIPHFVPPGHVLLFLVGWHLAPRLSAGV